MSGLAAADIVRAWELAAPLHAIDRALVLASCVAPELDGAALARLSLGERDALILRLHEALFGARIDAVVDCPACHAPLDVPLAVDGLRVAAPDVELRLTLGDVEVELRKLDSRDLAVVARAGDADEARRQLALRALVHADRELSPDELQRVAQKLEAIDPQADLVLALACADCAHEWSAPFDVAGFVWSELSMAARRLLQEVVTLAGAFKWSERDILAMTPERRAQYLELCGT